MIEDLVIRPLKAFRDERGWLCELFRHDEVPEGFMPVMGYVSVTRPGVVRGPHEHVEQTDYFCFLGSFSLFLWDNREDSPTYLVEMRIDDARDKIVIVPPGVVHAYLNTGSSDGTVLNFPDRLYRGWGKEEKVDEIRHEDDPESPFKVMP